jgi:Uncharacterized conserved protein
MRIEMNGYIPPYSLTDEMMILVASISEKLGKIGVYHSFETKPHLRRSNRIKSIHSSLKIEANSLTFGQVRDVLDGKLVLGPEKEIHEVKNAYEAYETIGALNPYSETDLKKAHGVLTKGLLLDSGEYRQGEEGVFNRDKCVFVAPPPSMVPLLMKGLFEWMNASKDRVHPLIMSAIFHYEFVYIHPFADGNGRTARLWHTVILSAWNTVFEHLPLESRIEQCQSGYYQAISDSHNRGNSNVFILFMLNQIDQAFSELILEIERADDVISEYLKKLLAVMDFEVPYTALTLMNRLGLKSRETFRKNYLDPAIHLGLVVRTLPEKPNSKNQRYVRK